MRSNVPLQDEPRSPESIVEELDRYASPATVAIAGPRYFGFVNGGALPAALATNWLSTVWEQHGAFQVGSPGSTRLEQIALRWTIALLGLPPTSGGSFVTGTTAGHITSLATARDTLLQQVGWNARADGLFGAPPLTVVVGGEAHSTLFKALGVVGLGRTRVSTVPVDAQGRMRAEAIPRLTTPTIVCVQAGNVNTGAFDPFRNIADHVRGFERPGMDPRRQRFRHLGSRRASARTPGRWRRARRLVGQPTRTSGSTCHTIAVW